MKQIFSRCLRKQQLSEMEILKLEFSQNNFLLEIALLTYLEFEEKVIAINLRHLTLNRNGTRFAKNEELVILLETISQ